MKSIKSTESLDIINSESNSCDSDERLMYDMICDDEVNCSSIINFDDLKEIIYCEADKFDKSFYDFVNYFYDWCIKQDNSEDLWTVLWEIYDYDSYVKAYQNIPIKSYNLNDYCSELSASTDTSSSDESIILDDSSQDY